MWVEQTKKERVVWYEKLAFLEADLVCEKKKTGDGVRYVEKCKNCGFDAVRDFGDADLAERDILVDELSGGPRY